MIPCWDRRPHSRYWALGGCMGPCATQLPATLQHVAKRRWGEIKDTPDTPDPMYERCMIELPRPSFAEGTLGASVIRVNVNVAPRQEVLES